MLVSQQRSQRDRRKRVQRGWLRQTIGDLSHAALAREVAFVESPAERVSYDHMSGPARRAFTYGTDNKAIAAWVSGSRILSADRAFVLGEALRGRGRDASGVEALYRLEFGKVAALALLLLSQKDPLAALALYCALPVLAPDDTRAWELVAAYEHKVDPDAQPLERLCRDILLRVHERVAAQYMVPGKAKKGKSKGAKAFVPLWASVDDLGAISSDHPSLYGDLRDDKSRRGTWATLNDWASSLAVSLDVDNRIGVGGEETVAHAMASLWWTRKASLEALKARRCLLLVLYEMMGEPSVAHDKPPIAHNEVLLPSGVGPPIPTSETFVEVDER